MPVHKFELPHVPETQQLAYCLCIMRKQHQELVPLRKEKRSYQFRIDKLEQEVKEWKEKYQRTKEELQKKKRENSKLKKEIEKLTKTKQRYQVALFDHGNFSHPGRSEKKKGGQIGHADTNRESREDTSQYARQRLFVNSCGHCGKKLTRVSATRQKILIDILMNPEVVKLLLASERQWCGNCKAEVYARDSRSLPFTEYGINTFMLVLILRCKAHASMRTIATIIALSHGLKLAPSDISNLVRQAKKYLKSRYDKLIQAIQDGDIMYADETGWLVHGQKAWMWIIATEEVTVYYAAESRGKGIAKELYGASQARCMHDGLGSYVEPIPADKQCYCWAHLLRFAHEETVNAKKRSKAVFLKDALVSIYHIKKDHPEYTQAKLEEVLRSELDTLLAMRVKTASFLAIQHRVRKQKEGLINSLVYTKDGTNNMAERELRPMVINKKISNGSNTFAGMETTAVLGSIIQTLGKKESNLLPRLHTYLTTGMKETHTQYVHVPQYAFP